MGKNPHISPIFSPYKYHGSTRTLGVPFQVVYLEGGLVDLVDLVLVEVWMDPWHCSNNNNNNKKEKNNNNNNKEKNN